MWGVAFKLLILLLMLFTRPLPPKYKVLSLVPVTNSISSPLFYAFPFYRYFQVWKCRIWISDCSHLHWLLNSCFCIYYTISINIICTVSICTVSINVTITSAITMYCALYVFCSLSFCFSELFSWHGWSQPLLLPFLFVNAQNVPNVLTLLEKQQN